MGKLKSSCGEFISMRVFTILRMWVTKIKSMSRRKNLNFDELKAYEMHVML